MISETISRWRRVRVSSSCRTVSSVPLYAQLFRYRPAVPLDTVLAALGFHGPEAEQDWNTFSGHFGLAFTDTSRSKLDCKTSVDALPLETPPATQ